MLYIKELSEQLQNLINNKDTKINIHFEISSPLLETCYEINQTINKYAFGFINLGTKYITVPHISIFMGYINTYEQLEFIISEIEHYSKTIDSFRIDPVRLYFKSATEKSSKYLFMDTLQNDFLLEQKKIIFDKLIDKIKPLEWDMKNSRPHITIGCYKNTTPKVIQLINSYKEFPICTIKRIGISLVGKKGICLGTLKSFSLN